MKRRDLILASTAIATGAGITGALSNANKTAKPKASTRDKIATPSLNKGLKEFRMATSWPKDFPGLGQMANRFAAGLGEISEGRINVKVFAAGELIGKESQKDSLFSPLCPWA